QLRAERAGDVAHRRHAARRRPMRLRFRAEEDSAALLFAAELLEVRLREPDAAAVLALVQGDAAERERAQGAAASRAGERARLRLHGGDRRAAVRAMLAADEHEPEARGARRRREPCV